MIPIVHIIYADKDFRVERLAQQVLALNPDFQVMSHDDEDCWQIVQRAMPQLSHAVWMGMFGVMRSDVCRYCALHAWGGFYLDTDVVPRKPLWTLLPPNASGEFFASSPPLWPGDRTRPTNYAMYVAPAHSAPFFDPINHSLTNGLRSIDTLRVLGNQGGAMAWRRNHMVSSTTGSLMLHAIYVARSTAVASGDIFPRYLEGICNCFCPPQRARMLTNPGCGLVHIGGTCDRDPLRKTWNQQLVLRAIDTECELQSWLATPTYQIPVLLILTGVALLVTMAWTLWRVTKQIRKFIKRV